MGTVRYTTVNGEVIAQTRAGVRRRFVPDALGSTVAMLDNTQTFADTSSQSKRRYLATVVWNIDRDKWQS